MIWTWNERQSDTWSHGTFETKEEAIAEATTCNNKDFYIGQCELIYPSTNPDIDRILEELDEDYHNNTECDDYIYEDVSEEDRKWLEDKLSDIFHEFHIRAKIEPGWFHVVKEEHIQLD